MPPPYASASSREDADAQARAHAARHGDADAFGQMLRNDLAAAQARQPKL